MAFPNTEVPEDKLPPGPMDDPYVPRPPRYISEEEWREMNNEEFRKSPAGKKFREGLGYISGPDPQTQFQRDLERETRRIGEEAEKRARELEGQLWGQARGEETAAQRQFAEQLAQTERLQTGAMSSVRGLSGERAKRYSGGFGNQLRLAGGQELKSLRASEMQEAEQALVRFQAQRDALALQYLSMAYSAEEAKRMANMEYEKMLTAWLQDQRRRQMERMNENNQMLGAALSGVGRVIGLFGGGGGGGK